MEARLLARSVQIVIHLAHSLVVVSVHLLFVIMLVHLHLMLVRHICLSHALAMALFLHLQGSIALLFHSHPLHLLLLVHSHHLLLLLHALLGLLRGSVLLVVLLVGLTGLRVGFQGILHHFLRILSSLFLLLGVPLVALLQGFELFGIVLAMFAHRVSEL